MNAIMKWAVILAVAVFLLPASTSRASTLEIVGTGDGLEILRALADRYTKLSPGARVEIPPSIGSGGGIAAVGSGRAPLGRIARELTPVEREAGIVYMPIAHLPSAFFTHPSSHVKSITATQLVGIYTGRITNWKDLGGADLRIRVVRREDIDSTLTILRQSMPGWRNIVITDRSKMATSTQDAIESAQTVPGAIGFAPYSTELEKRVTVLKVDELHPLDRAYPSINVLALIHLDRSVTREAIDFLAYSRSDEARQIISEYGGVPTPK